MYRARASRHPSRFRTALRAVTSIVPARIVNVSHTGCLFQVDGPLRRGQRISFTLMGERVHGTVIRDQVGRAAVRFDEPLNRGQLDALRLGSGSAEMSEHTHADRTTALRVMSRMVRRGRRRQIRDEGRQG